MSAPEMSGGAEDTTNAAPKQRVQKSEVSYQDQPHNGDECDECTMFEPPAKGSSKGSCTLVMGAINPKGWCTKFESAEKQQDQQMQEQQGQPLLNGGQSGQGGY